jgi:CRISPR-associated DxTHG motif protein
MKNTIVINILGSPGSGKSTLACELFVHLKRNHIDVEYINEFAKKLVWEGRFEELNNQYFIAFEQYKIIKNMHGKVDYIICDSPLVMSLFYNLYNKNNTSNVEKTSKMILERMTEHNKNSFYIFVNRDRNLNYDNNGRIHTESQSSEIELSMKKLCATHGINFFQTVTGDSIDKIVETILIR